MANALGAPSKIATSGMPMLARSARVFTVWTSQNWVVPSDPSMTCAPVDHLAMGFEISSEKNEPTNPTTAEKTSSMPTLRPCSVMNRSTPSTDSVMDSTIITAMLVMRNSTTRFIFLASLRRL